MILKWLHTNGKHLSAFLNSSTVNQGWKEVVKSGVEASSK